MESKTKYFQCERCAQIEPDSGWVVDEGRRSCKHCQAINEFEIWPSPDVRKLFETVVKYEKGDSFEYGLVASVFVSAALELLLERLLLIMALERMDYFEVGHLIDYLLDSNLGRVKRIQLYSRLGHGSFENESSEVGHKPFLKRWTEIATVRNKAVHGDLTAGTELEPAIVETTISEALAVFSKLHNKYNMETNHYRASVGRTTEYGKKRTKDLEEPENWNK